MRMTTTRSPWIAGVLTATLAIPPGALVRAQTQTPPRHRSHRTKPTTTTQTAKPAPATAKPTTAQPNRPARPRPPPGTNADTGWPRTVALKSGTATWYQPQIESWAGPEADGRVVGRGATRHRRQGSRARHDQDRRRRRASPRRPSRGLDLRITEYNFPSLAPEQVKALVADVQALPQHERVLDLDRLLAYIADSPLQVKNTEGIKADPPKIFSAAAPAILINVDGEPIWSPIKDVDLRYVVNTNWDLFEHPPTKTLLPRGTTRRGCRRPRSPDRGPPSGQAAGQLLEAAADDNWKDVKAAVPGKKLTAKTMPKVFVSIEPAELIVLEGPIELHGDSGRADAALGEQHRSRRVPDGPDRRLLLPGRRPLVQGAPGLDGPWTFATPTLPEDFKKIPVEHPRSRVLASVPGTPQATEAVVLGHHSAERRASTRSS